MPTEVTITFTERPELRASSIRVIDLYNGRVDNNDLKLTESEKTISVSLDKSKI